MDSNTRGATRRPASCVHVRVRVCVFMSAFVSSGLEVASAAFTSVLFGELIFPRVVSAIMSGCPGNNAAIYEKLVETHDPNQQNLDSDALASNTFGNEFVISVGSLRQSCLKQTIPIPKTR
jgi:hypothetical protein